MIEITGIEKYLATASQANKASGFLLYLDNLSFQVNEKALHKSASKLKKSACQQCGFCCLIKPCIPVPEELPAIAEYLHISVYKLIKTKMVIDKKNDAYFLLWAQETQLDLVGKFLPYYRTYDQGYCIFFNRQNNLCSIHPVKPQMAVQFQCWTTESSQADSNAAAIQAKWTKKIIKKLCYHTSFKEED